MTWQTPEVSACVAISIHIPRVGDDKSEGFRHIETKAFQSTSPVWGMTSAAAMKRVLQDISIHIPRVGDDLETAAKIVTGGNFNPHPPCGG